MSGRQDKTIIMHKKMQKGCPDRDSNQGPSGTNFFSEMENI